MKMKDLKQKSDKELAEMLKSEKSKRVEARFNVLGGNVKEIKESVTARKTIARILTLSQERKYEK